jgi:hypothetical protein
MCNNCSNSTFENEFQWNFLTLQITNTKEWKRFQGEKRVQMQGCVKENLNKIKSLDR